MSPQDHPTIYRNLATGDARFRRGRHNLTSESFSELSHRLRGQYQAFAMWLAYGEEFAAHFQQNEFSVKGWSGKGHYAFFDFVPFDFDADDETPPEIVFMQCRAFVFNELIARGFDERYFAIYLSGAKGFHVHVSPACFGGSPMADAALRFKFLAKGWKVKYPSLDLSLYEPTRLLRLPGTKHHKTGLFKTRISLEHFNLDYLKLSHVWAAAPSDSIPELSQDPPSQIIEIPELVATGRPDIEQIVVKANVGSASSTWL